MCLQCIALLLKPVKPRSGANITPNSSASTTSPQKSLLKRRVVPHSGKILKQQARKRIEVCPAKYQAMPS